jgi:hypothetical protein
MKTITMIDESRLLDSRPPVPKEDAPPGAEASEFLRLPRPGTRCPVTGLSRSYLNLLVLPCEQNGHKPPVRSFVLRRRGAATGVRLIDRKSLTDYIRQHAEGEETHET